MGSTPRFPARQIPTRFRGMINAFTAVLMMLVSASLLLGDGVSPSENSVVQIAVAVPGGSVTNFGTGFFIRDDGLIATASHVYLKALNAIVDARAGVVIARHFSRATRGLPAMTASPSP